MTPLAPCLMIQGPACGAGRSVLTAALCRLFAREGYCVRTGVPTAPVLRILSRGSRAVSDVDGATSIQGTVEGTYLHGVFADRQVRRGALGHLARCRGIEVGDRLDDLVEDALDMPSVARLVGLPYPRHPVTRL